MSHAEINDLDVWLGSVLVRQHDVFRLKNKKEDQNLSLALFTERLLIFIVKYMFNLTCVEIHLTLNLVFSTQVLVQLNSDVGSLKISVKFDIDTDINKYYRYFE